MAALATALAYGLWNLVLDAVVLYLAIRLRGRTPSWRVGLGAVVGAAYAFVPSPLSGGLPGHLAAACAMCLVAASYANLQDLVLQWGILVGTALLLGGATFGLVVMLTGHVPTQAHRAPGFAALIAATALLATERAAAADRVRRWAKAAASRASLSVNLRVRVGSRTRSLRGLVDTGNRLRDPITHRPVVILAAESFLDLVPEEARDGFRLAVAVPGAVGAALHASARAGDDASGRGRRPDAATLSWETRVQVVPYRGIGGRGLLTALRPDGLWEVEPGGADRPLGPALLALSPTPLGEGIDAVVPPGLWTHGSRRTVAIGTESLEAQDVVTMGA